MYYMYFLFFRSDGNFMKKTICLIISFLLCLSLLPYNITFADIVSFSDDPKAIASAAESVLMLTCYDEKGDAVATGSGFLALEDGIIITNYHVIQDDVISIKANTEDGMYFDVEEVVCYDAIADIAILRTHAKPRLDLLKLGDSDNLTKASKVITIGSPLGLLNTVSEGLYSGVIYDDTEYILFTAAISHGSSGGALLNENGEVIGITSASFVEGQNLNLAVPINSVKNLWNGYSSGKITDNIDLTIEEFYNQFDHTKEYSLSELMADPDSHHEESLIVYGFRGELHRKTDFVLYELYDDMLFALNRPQHADYNSDLKWKEAYSQWERTKPTGKTINIINCDAIGWEESDEQDLIAVTGKFLVLDQNNYTINASKIEKIG